MPTIFISYRRADSADSAGRMYDRLADRYGRAHIFKDVDSIPPGVRFAEYIVRSIEQSDIALIVIGPRWQEVTTESGQRRLDDAGDYVRIEIETALRLGVTVIPVLVGGAVMPQATALPESLRPLLQLNGLPVRPDPDFAHDMERVFTAIDYWQGQSRGGAAPSSLAAGSPAGPAVGSSVGQASAYRSLPAPQARPSAVAIGVAERPNRAPAKQRASTRRVKMIVSLVVALAVIAAGATALLSMNSFNEATARAEQTATANARAGTQTAIAVAALARQPFQPLGIGPCDPAHPSYWTTQPAGSVTCQSDKRTAYIANLGKAGFKGWPAPNGTFPSAFTLSMTVSFVGSDGPDACTALSIALPNDSAAYYGSHTVYVCRGGRWFTDNNPNQPAISGSSFHFVLTMTQSDMTVTINQTTVFPKTHYDGGVDEVSVGVVGDSAGTIAVTGFTLTPA